jgi:hypothetical protein
MRRIVARFMVHKVGSFVVKERVLCFGEYGFCTYDLDNKQITNTWPYEDVDAANVVEGESVRYLHFALFAWRFYGLRRSQTLTNCLHCVTYCVHFDRRISSSTRHGTASKRRSIAATFVWKCSCA